jgi:hypothetical protein
MQKKVHRLLQSGSLLISLYIRQISKNMLVKTTSNCLCRRRGTGNKVKEGNRKKHLASWKRLRGVINKEKTKYLKIMKQQIQPMNHTAIQDRNKNLQLRKGQTL